MPSPSSLFRIQVPALFLCVALGACQSPPDPRRTNFVIDKGNLKARYDPETGRLQKLETDLDKNGTIDSWTTMDGARIVRIEIDRDEDGKVERWEHYHEGRLASVGTSTNGDGVEDEWAYQAPDGSLARVETDTDRDGRIDKWQTYDPPRAPGAPPVLRSVAMDEHHAGQPTMRLLYRADGSFDRSEELSASGPRK